MSSVLKYYLKKKLMKPLYLTLLIIFTGTLLSCDEEIAYPRYSLTKINYIPDSLKIQHRVWITETIRAASQHMTGGDYEDVDDTIREVKYTANDLFEVSIIGLKIEVDEHYFNDLELKPQELNQYQYKVYEDLLSELNTRPNQP